MPTSDVKIVRDDGEPPWSDVADRISRGDGTLVHLADGYWQVAVLEHGMTSGKPSVALRLDLPNGTTVVSESSLDSLIAILAIARGAFPESFAGGPFAP